MKSNKHRPENARRARGFTLMELMVVIAILGILITLVAKNVAGKFEQSQQTDAKARCLEIEEAVYGYKMKHAKLPNSLEDLAQPDPSNNNEAWIDADRLKDPWDHQYIMKVEGSKVMIMSYGQDGQPGGEGYDADITKKGVQGQDDKSGN